MKLNFLFCILLLPAFAMAMEKDATKEYTSTLKDEQTFNVMIKLFKLEAKMLKNVIDTIGSIYKKNYIKNLIKPHGDNYVFFVNKKIIFGTFEHMGNILGGVVENFNNIKFTKNNLDNLIKKIISDRMSLKDTRDSVAQFVKVMIEIRPEIAVLAEKNDHIFWLVTNFAEYVDSFMGRLFVELCQYTKILPSDDHNEDEDLVNNKQLTLALPSVEQLSSIKNPELNIIEHDNPPSFATEDIDKKPNSLVILSNIVTQVILSPQKKDDSPQKDQLYRSIKKEKTTLDEKLPKPDILAKKKIFDKKMAIIRADIMTKKSKVSWNDFNKLFLYLQEFSSRLPIEKRVMIRESKLGAVVHFGLEECHLFHRTHGSGENVPKSDLNVAHRALASIGY